MPSSGALFLLLYQQLPLCVPPTRMIIGCTLLSFWLWRCISPHASYRTLHTPCGWGATAAKRYFPLPSSAAKRKKALPTHAAVTLFSPVFSPAQRLGCDEEPRCFTTIYIYMRRTRFEFIIFLYSRASKQPLPLSATAPPSDGFYLLGPGNKFTRAAWWAGN